MLKQILTLIIVATPSIFFLNLPEHFETPKYFFICLLLVLGIIFKYKELNKPLSKNDKMFLLYSFLYLISTIFSSNPNVSFWGVKNHYTGSLIFITFLISFLIISKSLIKNINLAHILKLIIYSSPIPFLYGYLQLLHKDFIVWSNPPANRIFSTFGQPNYFGIYVAVVLISLTILILEKGIYLHLITAFVTFILLLNTLSLSALTAFIVALLIYLIKRKKYINKELLIYLLIILITTFILFGKDILNRTKVQVIAKTTKKAIITNDTGKIRKILFISSLEQVLNNKKIFFLGSGPETFLIVYQRAPDLKYTSESHLYFVKPHNFFIEEFFETGLLGLAFYIWITYKLFKTLNKNPLATIGILILLYSFFNWPGPYMYFLLFFTAYYCVIKENHYLKSKK